MSRELKTGDELENSYVDERVKFLLPQFEAIAPYRKQSQRKNGVDKLPGWQKLATQEIRLLKITYPDDKPEHLKTYGTCLRQITALKKALKISIKDYVKDQGLHGAVNTIVTNFSRALTEHFAPYKANQSELYREKVVERTQENNRVFIDLTNSLKFAHNILTDIKNGNDVNWMDVSCSLALVTGRRMGEIHLSASFNKIDDYTIAFKGQLKGKSRRVKLGEKALPLRDVTFKIPTLIHADLVCFGLQWLADKGKRFDTTEDPERVNRRFSKTLNQHCKEFDIFPEDERTYHKFRAAYLRACVVSFKPDNYDYLNYARSILGDFDMNTIEAYQRYELKAGSITRI
ncbi:hypothetical protein NIES25_70120 (plasmid) [Nostoc linckia NIES-25]|nr:hypothetical protein NIES25_70120 [Nostoc linckia NIES-25]